MFDANYGIRSLFMGRALLVLGLTFAPFTLENAEAAKRKQTQTQPTGQSGTKAEPQSKGLKPTILSYVRADYSEEARRNGLEGNVILDAEFAANGNLVDIQVFSGLPDGLSEKALEAAKTIRFSPATQEGKPVSVRAKFEFTFSLTKSGATASKDQPATAETVYDATASERPKITYQERADYTPEAREKKIDGKVLLSVVFGADGKIEAIRVMNGLPYGLTEEAIDAARRIRFEPAMKDGKPVNVRARIEFSFSM